VASGHTSTDTEIFNAIIWTLDVTNKHPRIHLSRKASNCYSFIHIQNVATDLPLMWRQYIVEPTQCITHTPIPEDQTPRNEYFRILGYLYVQNLLSQCGIPNIDILVEETHKLYFLFTFEGSNFAYFMIPRDYATWYAEREVFYSSVHGGHFFVPISEETECRIKFNSTENVERMEHKFKIKFNSWDNIELKHPVKRTVKEIKSSRQR
jgi:hypothetical protein